jgi:peptidoglycan/LPS O-acetylase OafA/YrhL
VFLLSRARGLLSRVLGGPALVYGGEVSYALYMVHAIVLPVAFSLLPFPGPSTPLALRCGYFVLLLALVAAATAATHHWVEKPARTWMLARMRNKARRPPQEARSLHPGGLTD